MRMSFSDYFKVSWQNFKEGLINVTLFLPYFFSVSTLFKTMFAPWKNLTSKKNLVGFTFSEWFDRFMFNFISRGMGFFMRISIIFFYLITMCLYIISVPIAGILFFIFVPFSYQLYRLSKTEDEMKAALKTEFMTTHLLQQENSAKVEEWFEQYYARHYHRLQWWKLSNLYSTPPLARDWASGYTPTLDQFTTDLASTTYQRRLSHMVDREKEIDQIERVLSKSDEANVVLVGEEGVGKHTIVDALAKKIYEGKTNSLLMYKRILKLDMEKILTQYIDAKQREAFLKELLIEATDAKNIILFIDNFDKYISYGQDRIDMTTIIEEYARTAHLQVIGVTTPFFYQKYVVQNDKINRIFTKVEVYEVSKEEATQILLDTFEIFEMRYSITIPYETIINAIDKSDFYITAIPFPEKSMQLIDSSCVYVTEKTKTKNNQKIILQPQIIDAVLGEKTHIPTTLDDTLKNKLLQLESLLVQRIVNQGEAVKEVASTLRRSFILMGKRRKPLAAFLFLGPTGVGKTETAKAIADVFFGSENYLMRFDMSNFQSQNDIEKLIGSIETGNPGLLTKAVREQPYGVLLLDELEKADKNLLNIFLTILDEGYYTDGFGKRVDCKNLVIIATSNAGADQIYSDNYKVSSVLHKLEEQSSTNQKDNVMLNDDFSRSEASSETSIRNTSDKLINYLIEQKIYTPEFLNRFDGVIAFNKLENEGMYTIAKAKLQTVISELYQLYKIKVNVSDSTLQNLIKTHYNPNFGARDMDRILRQELEDKIAKMILSGEAKEGGTINL